MSVCLVLAPKVIFFSVHLQGICNFTHLVTKFVQPSELQPGCLAAQDKVFLFCTLAPRVKLRASSNSLHLIRCSAAPLCAVGSHMDVILKNQPGQQDKHNQTLSLPL